MFFGLVVVGVLALIALAVIPGGGPGEMPSLRPQQAFYGTAAQVIPVLILAFVIERRWLGWPRGGRLLVAALLLVGELAALLGAAYALPDKRPTAGHTYPDTLIAKSPVGTDILILFVTASLAVGLSVVLYGALVADDSLRREGGR
jgi:hypothetical protein